MRPIIGVCGFFRAVKRLATFLGRSPDTATPEELRALQLHQGRKDRHAMLSPQLLELLRVQPAMRTARLGLAAFPRGAAARSCLEVGVLDPSILKTERPPVTRVRSNDYCADAMRPTSPPHPPRESGFGSLTLFGLGSLSDLSPSCAQKRNLNVTTYGSRWQSVVLR
jgi:hypothetical protein